jgi:hypothetical protein
MHPICLDGVTAEQLHELDDLYQTTNDARVRIRVLMVLLAAERKMVAADVASLLRQHEETVRRWIARYLAEGTAGLYDAPRCRAPPKVTTTYREHLLEAVTLPLFPVVLSPRSMRRSCTAPHASVARTA